MGETKIRIQTGYEYQRYITQQNALNKKLLASHVVQNRGEKRNETEQQRTPHHPTAVTFIRLHQRTIIHSSSHGNRKTTNRMILIKKENPASEKNKNEMRATEINTNHSTDQPPIDKTNKTPQNSQERHNNNQDYNQRTQKK